ncbi:MAG: Riboflavin biosynthesis protein RibD [Chlamydiales bacterium]|nr:Riboflavin biosynthesis protein RibD [Chlamydiales bacterium]
MPESKEQQQFFMRWAIQVAQKGRTSAPPNPWVGCVIVKEGEILAEGYHERVGKEHAEVAALNKAGPLARGATAYITLEPCSHQGRTPPCADALIEAGIAKVFIPFLDPDPQVAGEGVKKLEAAGIEVNVGLCRDEAARALEPYLFHRRTKRPFTVLKVASSLDGRTAAADGTSQWITDEPARYNVHLLRAQSQAILVGAQTALLDQPKLTARGVDVLQQPLRIVLDSQGKVPPQGPLADTQLAPTLIFSCKARPEWEKCGAEVITWPKIELSQVLDELGKRNIVQLLVEGGSQMHTAFLKEKLAQRLVLYIGACVLGDQGKPLLTDCPITSIQQAWRWTLKDVARFGQDVRLDYSPR